MKRRKNEGGFALLIVFLMAAAIALMLYQQIPRVAFESQRDKEDSLIARGEQYKRAIQLYFLEFKKYPAKIEDLESTNNKRFLRRRYIDPMTGKDEWRLIHVNGAGQLTDSLVQKPPSPTDANNQNGQQNGQPGTQGPLGTGNTNANASPPPKPAAPAIDPVTGQPVAPEVNATVQRRPSDRALVSSNQLPGVNNNPNDVDPNDPKYWPPIFSAPANQQGTNQPGAQPNGVNPQGFNPQFPGQQFPGQQYPGQPVQNMQFNGQPNQAGQPLQVQPYIQQQPNPQPQPGQDPNQPQTNAQQLLNGQPNAIQPDLNQQQLQYQQQQINNQQPFNPTGSTLQPVPTGQTFNQNGQAAPNPALGMINTLLTTPRQTAAPAATNNTQMTTGGLAGVASTYTGPSIKTYKERSKYNEWEFIFDLKTGIPGQTTSTLQPQQSPTGTNNGTGSGTTNSGSGSQSSSPFFQPMSTTQK